MKHTLFLLAAGTLTLAACSSEQPAEAPSLLQATLTTSEDGSSSLSFSHEGTGTFAEVTQLGLITPLDSTSTWKLASMSEPTRINESYDMKVGKRLHCQNQGLEQTYTLEDGLGHSQLLQVRTFPDGLAFRYVLSEGYETPQPLLGERTTLQLRSEQGGDRWLQHWTEPYEDFFPQNPEEHEGDHWGYPALFSFPSQEGQETLYVLLSEADVTRGHSASSFYTTQQEGKAGYHIQPDLMESLVQTGWATPWRVLISGTLGQVVESTLITDLSQPCELEDTDWIAPGVASWIYWAYNHGSNDYQIVCQYIDMAKALQLPYTLIDAEWDEMKNGGTIEDALNYAKEQGVKPLIWYNSTTAWIGGAPGPQYRLNDPEKREREFQWCEDHGVAGVKIDFFQGDRESAMNYCIDLLESAARHHLMVNFHGATIPRGWFRTYPNLMTTEAVYGAEWYNNLPVLTNRAAAHNAMLPFTRNVIGSMDYTPCTFTDSQHPHITSHGHELALTALFESGLQHLADRPSAYLDQPQAVQDYLSTLPSAWDETHLVCGYPGHHAVLARRHDDCWYIAGINGTDEPLTLDLDLQAYDSFSSATLFTDGSEGELWCIKELGQLPDSITMKERGGFVIVTKK